MINHVAVSITVVYFSFLFASCVNNKQKEESTPPETVISEETGISIKEIEEKYEQVKHIGMEDSDALVFNQEQFEAYYHSSAKSITEDEYNRYQINNFLFAPSYSGSLFLIPDTIRPRNRKYYSLLFGIHNEAQSTIWMANYNKEDDRFIDSRRLYEQRPTRPGYGPSWIHSIFYPHGNRIHLSRPSAFFEEVSLSIQIHTNGLFEEFPDEEFSTNTVAVGPCTYNMLKGKYPVGETWTTLSFRYGGDNEQIEIEKGVTQNPYLDDLEYTGTLLYNPEVEDLHFSIAFKGVFPEDHFRKIEFTNEELYGHPVIADFLPLKPEDTIYDFSQGQVEEQTKEVQSLRRYIINEEEYWFAQFTDETLMGVSIGTTSVRSEEWSPRYMSFYFLFYMGDEVMMYLETVPSEGAARASYLYQLNNGFNLIYEDTIVCD